MSLKIVWRDEYLCPVFYCDVCAEVLHGPRAVAVFNTERDRPNNVGHAHKGKCHNILEDRFRRAGRPGWVDLEEHARYLGRNVRPFHVK